MSLQDISKFERQNDISVSVFCFEEYNEKGKFGNIHRSSFKRPIHVNLLMIVGSDRAHYCLIQDKSILFRSYKSAHNGKLFFVIYA